MYIQIKLKIARNENALENKKNQKTKKTKKNKKKNKKKTREAMFNSLKMIVFCLS